MRSANPAARRTAIYLLREFGGDEALPELTQMLEDADGNVQREAVRAIAVIGTDRAYQVLTAALASDQARTRDAVIGALASFRDARAVPLFAHLVRNKAYRRTQRTAWVAAVEGLGAAATSEAVAALRGALYEGEWWAPLRTASLRKAVAAALRRAGTPEAQAVLEQAAASGPRSARSAAQEQIALGPARGRTP
jgi:HEAT repeat protein